MKSPSGMYWIICLNGIEVDRFDRKYEAQEALAAMKKLL
tara:strand:+ start:2749 stop:2865 length:117 start_codon:yes stop_codon:yes gene_type:complete